MRVQNKSLTAVLVDDESESLDLLESLICSTGKVKIIGKSLIAEEAVQLISESKPDIIFLDIRMPGMSGFEVLDKIQISGSNWSPYVVFITAFEEFAIKAFDYGAYDFLLKPVELHRLEMAIKRCIERPLTSDEAVSSSSTGKLIYRTSSGFEIIDLSDIIYIEAQGNYSVFSTKSGKTETITVQLGKIEEQLPAHLFIRCSRSHIINVTHVKKINTVRQECLLMGNGSEYTCKISKDKVRMVLEMIR